MIIALAIDLSREWLDRVNLTLADRATVVPTTTGAVVEAARRVPIALAIVNLEPLTTRKLLDCQSLLELHAPILVCIGREDSRAQLRTEKLFLPDFWLSPEAGLTELQETLELAEEKVRLRGGQQTATAPGMSAAAPAAASTAGTRTSGSPLQHMLAAFAESADLDRLLPAYVESATQVARCAGYCLLWEDPQRQALVVKRSQGLPSELAQHGRLGPNDALVAWYGRNCRAVTRQELLRRPDDRQAAAMCQELEIFRGEAVIPMLPGGNLCGLLILGEKIVGEPYSPVELEALYALTGYMVLRLENLQLQEQVRHTQLHMERSLAAMPCGLITLGQDGRIVVCNAHAARLLGRAPAELEGADLRALPSPLGDHLYAAYQSPEAAVSGEHVALPHRDLHLRLTTSTLFSDSGERLGAVLLLEDMSEAVEDATAAARQDTVNTLTRIIGRIAHEVRTPLTAIKTYAQLMSEPEDMQELARFWRDTVSPELERLDRLISEQVALVEQPEPAFQLVRLEQIVEQAVARAAQEHQTAPPAMKVNGPLPQVVADPGPTLDALSYLMRYLYDYGSSAVGVVVEQQSKEATPKVRVRMRVRANGRQPDPKDLLDPLAVLQLDHGDLGPAISRQLVHRQGGSVEAVDGEDYLEFRVSFPVSLGDRSFAGGTRHA